MILCSCVLPQLTNHGTNDFLYTFKMSFQLYRVIKWSHVFKLAYLSQFILAYIQEPGINNFNTKETNTACCYCCQHYHHLHFYVAQNRPQFCLCRSQ